MDVYISFEESEFLFSEMLGHNPGLDSLGQLKNSAFDFNERMIPSFSVESSHTSSLVKGH